MLQYELIFCEPVSEPCSTLENGLDDEELQQENNKDLSWDEVFLAEDEIDDIETEL